MKIDLTPLSLKADKPIEVKHAYLLLDQYSLEYSVNMLSNRPEDSTIEDTLWIWEEKIVHFYTRVLKTFVVGVDTYYSKENKAWRLDILISGCDDMYLFFKTREQAIDITTKIFSWLH